MVAGPRRTSEHATPDQVEAWEKTRRPDGAGLCPVCRNVWTPIAGICSTCEFEKIHRLPGRE